MDCDNPLAFIVMQIANTVSEATGGFKHVFGRKIEQTPPYSGKSISNVTDVVRTFLLSYSE